MGRNVIASKKEAKMVDIYQELSNMAENINIRHVLEVLSSECMRHKNGLLKDVISREDVTNSTLIDTAKMHFTIIKDHKESINISELQVDLFNQALSFLYENEDHYKLFALEEKNDNLEDIFYCLSEESHKHYIILKEILEYNTDSEKWLSNASFLYIDEY